MDNLFVIFCICIAATVISVQAWIHASGYYVTLAERNASLDNHFQHLIKWKLSKTMLYSAPIPEKGTKAMDQKAKIGSKPPSCGSKCNLCRPCVRVKITLPPSRGSAVESNKQRYENTITNLEQQSPYYTLVWKCRCKGEDCP
eukprot:c19491_g1_i3 orf=726-1154(+)